MVHTDQNRAGAIVDGKLVVQVALNVVARHAAFDFYVIGHHLECTILDDIDKPCITFERGNCHHVGLGYLVVAIGRQIRLWFCVVTSHT